MTRPKMLSVHQLETVFLQVPDDGGLAGLKCLGHLPSGMAHGSRGAVSGLFVICSGRLPGMGLPSAAFVFLKLLTQILARDDTFLGA